MCALTSACVVVETGAACAAASMESRVPTTMNTELWQFVILLLFLLFLLLFLLWMVVPLVIVM